jgi:hypothetical protein
MAPGPQSLRDSVALAAGRLMRGLLNGQSPPALLTAAGQDFAAVRRAHPGAEPVFALSFFNRWMIGGIHKFSPISMDQFSAAGLQPESRRPQCKWQ